MCATLITELLHKLRVVWKKQRRKQETIAQSWLLTVAIASLGVTAIVLGSREFKGLQLWELSAYDQMLRLRPKEAPDSRILLVTITEDDIQHQPSSLSDTTINRLLAKLQSYQPRVIGLDIYRTTQKNLAVGLAQNKIITACAFSSSTANTDNPEIAPPPNFPINNVGFTDLLSDEDHVVRRSLLFAHSEKDRKCKTQFSFAAQLAIKYLEKENIKLAFPNHHDFQFGKTLFHTLNQDSGNYEHLDAKGHQILINYHDPNHFVKQVTLTQVLTNHINPNLVKDRLVIVGTTARAPVE